MIKKARPTLTDNLAVFQRMPQELQIALKEKLEASVEDCKQRIDSFLDEAERHLRDQTMGQSVVRNFQRRGYEELEKCQEAETKLNEDWKTLKTTIEADVDSMRGIYVRIVVK